jgi:hypothetical protein
VARSFASASTDAIVATITPTIASTGTIAFRARPLFSPGDGTYRFFFAIVNAGTPANNNLKLYRYSDNNFYLDFQALGSLSQASAADTGVFASGVWADWIVTWDNSVPARNMYVGNVLKMTSGAAFNIPTTSDTAYIGQNNGGGSISFYGDLCDVGSSTIVWSANDRAMYRAGYTFDQIRPDAIANYWPLVGGASPEQNLWSANAGVLTGTTVSANPPLMFPRRRGFTKGGATVPPPPPARQYLPLLGVGD